MLRRNLLLRMTQRLLAQSLAVLALGLTAEAAAQAADQTVRFNRDIRPIISENCFHCHGPDPGSRKAGLRLDTKEGFFESTPKRSATVISGNPEKSELFRRIMTTDEEDIMPPPKEHKVLKPEQKQLIKRWIEQGAPWEPHWSFLKPERPVPPSIDHAAIRNPIDCFVSAKLAEKKLSMNPEADRRTLARRLSLDLTGLPPMPADVDAFVKDKSPGYYEKFVDRLMATPQWGEHRGRYWLDAARYADTHGLHFDNYREMWPYRDWVIRAFNANKPFDQFTVEQIAGDLLPDATDDQKTATGFQRCNMTTNEGGTIEEENLANYANDRVTTVGWVFLGLTANCAACHDHKFDPITQRDFYSMAAFFRNTRQSGFDKNMSEGDLSMVVYRDAADKARSEVLVKEIAAAKTNQLNAASAAKTDFTNWLASAKAPKIAPQLDLDGEYLRLNLNDGAKAKLSGDLNGRRLRLDASTNAKFRADGPIGSALILRKNSTLNLGQVADFERNQPFSVGGWIYVPTNYSGNWSIIGKVKSDTPAATKNAGWDLSLRGGGVALTLTRTEGSSMLQEKSPDKSVATGKWQHVFATFDGGSRGGSIKIYLDGVSQNLSGGRNNIEGSIRNDVPLRIGQRETGEIANGLAAQDLRIFKRVLDPTEVKALAWSAKLPAILTKPSAERATNEVEALQAWHLVERSRDWRKSTDKLLALQAEQKAIRVRAAVTHQQAEKVDSMPMANVLARGQYDQKKDQVVAAPFGALHKMPAGAPTNRLGLAQWLVSPENTLLARVTVNRFWQELFGAGLVKTSEDLGIMGDAPANQELLDWLAVEFRESGWNVKHLFKLMVTSAAYRQDAKTTPEKLEKDPANRLLSRGPRFRMDAEMVRDFALATSGLIVGKVGGPSVKPYQPDGVWEAVAMPESNTRYYQRDTGDALYRRSLYTFWKRAAPPASMDVFNAPSRETCSVRRERTNTPLQALATLNDIQMIEAARHLAQEALIATRGRREKAIDFIARRVLSRSLTDEETKLVDSGLAEFEAYYASKPEDAAKLIAVGDSKASTKVKPVQLAAVTMLANKILNLDEAISK